MSVQPAAGGLPPTNAEIFSQLTKNIAQSILQATSLSAGDTCEVKFMAGEGLEFLEHSFIETLQKLSFPVISGSAGVSQAVYFEVQPSRSSVVYENMFRSGLFGEKKVERSIIVELSIKLLKKPEGLLLFAGARQDQHRDTVGVRVIEQLESPTIKATHASMPAESFFERIVEPFVIVGATGVLMYLFFTVRSS